MQLQSTWSVIHWKRSSLRIIFLKKKIGKEDYFTISYIYNLPVVDARDYLIQRLGFFFWFFFLMFWKAVEMLFATLSYL